MKNYKLEKLQNGETFITSEKGNSIIPFLSIEIKKALGEKRKEKDLTQKTLLGDGM